MADTDNITNHISLLKDHDHSQTVFREYEVTAAAAVGTEAKTKTNVCWYCNAIALSDLIIG